MATAVAVEHAPSFLDRYLHIARRPAEGFTELATEARALRLGALALASNAIFYTFVYAFLVLGHGRPTAFHPWLALDPEIYYRWNVVLVAPSMALAWIVAGAVAQLLARAAGGRGSFENTTAVLGFGTAIASWTTLFHDLVTSFLGAVHVIDQRAYEDALNAPTVFRALLWVLMGAYLVAFVLYFARGIEAVHRLSRSRSLAVGGAAFLAYQLVFVIFNR